MPPCVARFDAAVAALQAQHAANGPGFCLGLAHQGRVLRQVHHGMAHLEWPQPLAADTRFYLASESKTWVAALVMQEVAAGRVRLDSDMRPLLPALADCTHPVRLGHLLRHSSGLADYLHLWGLQLAHHEDDLVSQEQALALILRAGDGEHPPGQVHDYCNSNYVLLADWLARACGQPLDQLAQQRLFGPWGMAHTGFERDPSRVLARRARSYEATDGGAWRDRPVNLGTWGDGGLWSTLDDLLRAEAHWLADWQAQGALSLLGRCLAAPDDLGPAGHPYRLGVEVMDHGGRSLVFHGGGYAGFTSLALRDLNEGTALVLLANVAGFDNAPATWAQRLWPI